MYFHVERIKRTLVELKLLAYRDKISIDNYKMKECSYNGYELLDEEATKENGWCDFKANDRWGGKDKHFWFKTVIQIPDNYEGKTIFYEVKTGKEGQWDAKNPQFLAYINGKATQGLDVNHTELLLCEKANPGEIYEIALYAYGGMEDGLVDLKTSLGILEKDIEKLYYNIKVPVEVAELLGEEDKKRIDILKYLIETINKLDFRKRYSESFYNSLREASSFLEEEFYGKYCGEEQALEVCIGHTHIDVAWMWTLAQTREKVARSFSTVLNLMDQYPEYKFMSSQPQLYKYLKEDHPELYKEVKERVKEGRWEPEGAMWLEADCNLTSGESLIRQILHGKKFFKDEFNTDSKILWLPDVFGYSAALPQILKKSGVDYFMTTKISWNEYNKLPYDTFMWRGIDGTEVLTHFITTTGYSKEGKIGTGTTYNGNTDSSSVMGCWQRYQQKDINDVVLNCFGHGDGGGGATKGMLENLRRLEKGIPGAPKTKIATAGEFFKNLDEKVNNNKKLPKWVGELYLEYHRGTYTSMARNKKYNRKTEFLNMDAELYSTINNVITDGVYPKKELNACWETTLLNQFHDIIPGSSIKEVYDDSKKDYERINAIGNKILNSALDNIASKINLSKTSVIVFNQLGFDRDDIVEFNLPEGWENAKVYDEEEMLLSQLVEGNKVVFYVKQVPAKGYKSFTIEKCSKEDSPEIKNITAGVDIDTGRFSISFDENYNISSIFDKKNNREVIKNNEKANVLQVFEDKPHNWDAWDINIYYQDKMWEVNDVQKAEVIEQGPVRTTLKVERKFLDSTIVQYIRMYKDIERIDFYNDIDWKEEQMLLKAAFPVDIHSDKATYEIQYGNVERPTHWNTSWDYARFEVCAHKWADLSEGDYGVALINDSKFGHDIKDSTMRLSLLKCAIMPNPEADKEKHNFVYSIYPHSGDWKESKVVNMSYTLNCPMYAKVEQPHEGELQNNMSFIKINKDNVIVEVIKQAEESEHVIVRMYECHNKRTSVTGEVFKSFAEVVECNLMENDLNKVKSDSSTFEFEIKPYEIKTFKIKF
jgi:alpha-mannosidase